jgi:hypothetical protein
VHENEKAPLTKSTHRFIANGAAKFTKAPLYSHIGDAIVSNNSVTNDRSTVQKTNRCSRSRPSQQRPNRSRNRTTRVVGRNPPKLPAAIPEVEYMGEAEIDDESKAEGYNQ